MITKLEKAIGVLTITVAPFVAIFIIALTIWMIREIYLDATAVEVNMTKNYECISVKDDSSVTCDNLPKSFRMVIK